MKSKILGLLAVGLLAQSAQAASIDYAANGDLISHWGPSAIGGGQSYGVIFTAPQTVLQSFAFAVQSDSSLGPDFQFAGQVYSWNGTGVDGAALYTSATLQTTTSLTTYTFSPGIALAVGNQYIAVVSPSGGTGYGLMAASNDADAQQNFRYATLGTGTWYSYSIGPQFHADFSDAVPEPGTLALLGLGLLGLGVTRRKAN